MRSLRTFVAIGTLLASVGVSAQDFSDSLSEVIRVDLPDLPSRVLKPHATLSYQFISESSGMVRSRSDPDRFWTHNDSGDFARLFPVNRQGVLLENEIRVRSATNRDWEDIGTDDTGHLLIADIGNNLNKRTDLGIYILDEPDPSAGRSVENHRWIPIHYPDQQRFPPKDKNFDGEAIFWAHGSIYVLTKHRSDTNTTLYRLDSMDESESNELTRLGSFDIGGQVTAADALDNRLVVLTYSALWMFESPTDAYFRGRIWWLPISARQCEAVCFDGPELVLTNEQRQIFRVPTDELVLVREPF